MDCNLGSKINEVRQTVFKQIIKAKGRKLCPILKDILKYNSNLILPLCRKNNPNKKATLRECQIYLQIEMNDT